MRQNFGLRELASQILSIQVAANLTESRGILLQVVASRQSLLWWSWQNSHTPHNAIDQHSSLSHIHDILLKYSPPNPLKAINSLLQFICKSGNSL